IATTIKALEQSLVLSIPQQQLTAKLQQDTGFASRFDRVVATVHFNRLQEIFRRLGYGKPVDSKNQLFDKAIEYEDELDFSVLDRMALLQNPLFSISPRRRTWNAIAPEFHWRGLGAFRATDCSSLQ
ncbi:MAG: hypothetical protein AB1589_44075, partial [Cyanobacteriota bacterium]